jgi:soluble lytic murein transglycosylase-like protein
MQPKITFCSRCRGMRTGWNKRYTLHCLFCKQWLRKSSRFCGLIVIAAALLMAFPAPSATVFSNNPEPPVHEVSSQKKVEQVDPAAVAAMEAFLKQHAITQGDRTRLAESIVTSARKHNLNPRLLASVMIVESRGNQFAISGKDAIGIMQIHLPTWGRTADREGINLFKIEDNIDFGARILKNYIRQFGLWEGVKRYNGCVAEGPASEQSVPEYVAKVQRVYESL